MDIASPGATAFTRASHAGDGPALSWESLAAEARYRPNDLAKVAGVSLRTLQRYFRARFNCTVTDWLRKLRLERARTQLVTGQSVKEVAFDLGYKQPSHFTRDFKDRFGVPPRMLLRGRFEGDGPAGAASQKALRPGTSHS